ncbi:porin family protein [Lutibacter citreus]|uniref:porin family protein n=1 Tax=Lutibacter citreus TaxID=2138210 RepID=UPI000DBEA809|nr:porin family protein [Lutibacter citreus]
MKKVLLIAVITILGLTNVNAQDINFGIKGGLNFASISGDNTENIDPVTAFNLGIMSEIQISNKFSFQPELMFSGVGYSIEDDTVALNYLNIPLMAKYYLTKGFSVEAGPQIGYLLSAKNESVDIKDSFNSVDFGLNVGIGYKLDNGLNFGARYNFGLSDINKSDVENINGFTGNNKNSALQISIGYFFF